MYRIAQQPWSDTVNLQHLSPIVKIGYKAVIITRLSGPDGKLQTRYMVSALYKGVLAMANGKPGFYRLSALVYLQDSLIGSVQVDRLGDDPGQLSGTLSSIRQRNDTLTYRTGQIVDPKDPSTRINYTFGGRTLTSQAILTAVLDGLAATAQFAGGSMRSVTGWSVSGDTKLFFGGVLGRNVLAKDATRALYLVVLDLVVAFGMYEEVSFDLFTSGRWTAGGAIEAIAKESNGRDVVASS